LFDCVISPSAGLIPSLGSLSSGFQCLGSFSEMFECALLFFNNFLGSFRIFLKNVVLVQAPRASLTGSLGQLTNERLEALS
jgi:hypothetical protein